MCRLSGFAYLAGLAFFLSILTCAPPQVWVHEPSLMRWLVSVELPLSQRVSSVAWSNPLGRPLELIAIATGTNVTLFSLNGPADKLQVCLFLLLTFYYKAPLAVLPSLMGEVQQPLMSLVFQKPVAEIF